ncbi:Rix1 complex component [Syncephalis plumigaleata]|nr:Rix1 complex component [Syncephalis plumigaleata]
MPKNTRKKKLKVEDFQKQKLKVGKKKLTADNATSTSFKAQAVVLPGQSITQNRSDQATNSRHQTLSSLTGQLKHYSASTRRDALTGLSELFRIHPHLLATSLGSLVNLLSSLLVDEDNQTELAPFLPILVVYTRSAMTHLNEAVQAGSLQFLDLWLRLAPEFVVAQQAQLMPNYIGLLNGHQGQSSLNGSMRNAVFINPKSLVGSQKLRVDVLGSLCRFLEASTAMKAAELMDDRYWFFRNYLAQPVSTSSVGHRTLSSSSRQLLWSTSSNSIMSALLRAPDALMYTKQTSLAATTRQFNPFAPMTTTELLHLLDSLRPSLLAIWLEAAPNVFTAYNGTPSNESLGAVYLILRVLRTLWRAAFGGQQSLNIASDWINENMKSLLQHFTVYFPYGQDIHKLLDKRTETILHDMNAAFCELVSFYLLVKEQNTYQRSKADTVVPAWAGQVVDYILKVFNWHTSYTTGKKEKMNDMTSSVDPEQLTAIMPSVWTFLNYLFIQAICAYGEQCHATSPSRRLCVEFIAHITKTVTHSQYKGMLWNLKLSHPETTSIVLDALTDAAKYQCTHGPLDDQFLKELQLSLIPFFHVTLPGKGPLFGPFISLPSDVQRKAIELLYYLNELNERLQQAIVTCQHDQRLDDNVRDYLCTSISIKAL